MKCFVLHIWDLLCAVKCVPSQHTRRGSPRLGEVSGTRALDFQWLCCWEAETGGRPQCGFCGEASNSERPSSSRCFGGGEWGRRCRGGPGAHTTAAAVKGRGVSRGRDWTRAGGSSGFQVHCLPGHAVEKMSDTQEGERDSDQVSVQAPRALGGGREAAPHPARAAVSPPPGGHRFLNPHGCRDFVFSVLRWHRPGLAEQTPSTRAARCGFGMTAS